jgi:hypothetical protein
LSCVDPSGVGLGPTHDPSIKRETTNDTSFLPSQVLESSNPPTAIRVVEPPIEGVECGSRRLEACGASPLLPRGSKEVWFTIRKLGFDVLDVDNVRVVISICV